MNKFTSDLSYKIYNLALKTERIAKMAIKKQKIDNLEQVAALHKLIEDSINNCFISTSYYTFQKNIS